MAALDFSKFDKAVDLEGLKKDILEAEENGGGDFKEVPEGEYEVSIDKLELVASKNGDPMVSCWFKILNGEFKGSRLFMNQVVTLGFQIHKVDEFLRSLDSGVEITFESYTQYAQLLMDVHEAVDKKLEYGIKYKKDSKGFSLFEITDIYEVA